MIPVGLFSGTHVLAELTNVDPAVADDETLLRDALAQALTGAGATVCEIVSKRFVPQGVTALALLSESHASLHTYPENGSVFVDVFTCGEHADPEVALRLIAIALRATVGTPTVLRRGDTTETPDLPKPSLAQAV